MIYETDLEYKHNISRITCVTHISETDFDELDDDADLNEPDPDADLNEPDDTIDVITIPDSDSDEAVLDQKDQKEGMYFKRTSCH